MIEDKDAFAVRCSARQRERQLGTGYGFGIFVEGQFGGEINLSSVQRGPFQSAYVGYWIDEKLAGNSYTPEAVVVLCRFVFDELHLHRLQIAIIPRNASSRRVVEKLALREEGTAASLPRDQRRLGGPRALRHHPGGLARPPRAAPHRVGGLTEIRACIAARRSANSGWSIDQSCTSSSRSTAASCSSMPATSANVALVRRTSSWGAAAARAAMASAAPASSASATQRHTNPIRSASAPSSTSPNSTMAAAADDPTARCSIHVWPPPGWIPSCRKRVSKRAEAPASRTSQASARFMPAPTAAPLTAARVGSGERATRRKPS